MWLLLFRTVGLPPSAGHGCYSAVVTFIKAPPTPPTTCWFDTTKLDYRILLIASYTRRRAEYRVLGEYISWRWDKMHWNIFLNKRQADVWYDAIFIVFCCFCFPTRRAIFEQNRHITLLITWYLIIAHTRTVGMCCIWWKGLVYYVQI